jgi:serine/threonine-protein phosphatase 2B catalytic subunit
VTQAAHILAKEPTLIVGNEPITVVGDIHGQFYDLVKLLEIGGDPSNETYLFLGDYVDRGNFSVEVIALLFALKINYPANIILLRGNHECRQLTSFFNFRTEVLSKYDLQTYDYIMEAFDCLPLACIISDKFIALHGGISPDLVNISDLNAISRFTEPPKQGLMCDVLWADPVEDPKGKASSSYVQNTARLCSYYFNVEAVNRFLQRNDLIAVIRAHEAQMDGYKMHRWNGLSEFPCVITIFSCPNYCGVYKNKAAIIKLENSSLNIQQFNFTPEPYLLPDFMDIFTWSVPFLLEKILSLIQTIVARKPGDDSLRADHLANLRLKELLNEVENEAEKTSQRRNQIYGQLLAEVTHLKTDREFAMKLRGEKPLTYEGGLMANKQFLSVFQNFAAAKRWDAYNERMP